MNCTTFRADPLSYGERQALRHMSTTGTCFAAGVKSIDRRKCGTVPDRLIGQLPPELCPTHVSNMPGQPVIPQHPADVQVLNNDL